MHMLDYFPDDWNPGSRHPSTAFEETGAPTVLPRGAFPPT